MIPRVEDIMTKEVITVKADTTVREAAKIMRNHGIGALVVVDDGKPIGIITERDLVKRVVAEGLPFEVKVGDVMSKPLLTVEPNLPATSALDVMTEHNIRRVVVTDSNGNLVGILSVRDFVKRWARFVDLFGRYWFVLELKR